MQPSRLVFLLAVLSASSLIGAQSASTSLRGTVSDPTGAALPGAVVSIEDAAVGFKASATANGRGEYSFQQLTPGHYLILSRATGFGQANVSADLLVAQPATINLTLKVTSDATVVDVSAAAETINTTDATIGDAINNETIMALPSEARNPQTLLALQPGVLFLGTQNGSADSRNGVVSGARADQTNITLDGVDNNDQVAPAAFTGVLRTTLDATEEFRVTTSDANADTGRSSGGQVNLVTKSGTNQVHGALYEYNRNSFGIANDWFLKNSQIQAGEPNRPGKLVRNTFGAALGGPLKKDKIFLFGNFESNRQFESVTAVRTVPTASFRAGMLKYLAADGSTVTLTPGQFALIDNDPGCQTPGPCTPGLGVSTPAEKVFNSYPLPNGTLQGDGLNNGSFSFSSTAPLLQKVYITRLDLNPSDKHRFYLRGSFQNDASTRLVAQFPGLPPNSIGTDDSKGISANYTWTARANLVNNLRYGFTRQSLATDGIGKTGYVTFNGIDTREGTTHSSATIVPSHNLIDDLTLTEGKHTVQFGGNLRRFSFENVNDLNSYTNAYANAYWFVNGGLLLNHFNLDPGAFGLPPVSGNFNRFYDIAATTLAGLIPEEMAQFNYRLSADGATGTLLAQGAPVHRSFRSNEVEYYGQDTWRVLPNLTVTAGLRHTILQTPWETNGQQVQPTINIHQWFSNRAQGAAIGQSIQPDISFAPAGKFHGGKPFYPINWGNLAPRLAIAFSPVTEHGSFFNRLMGNSGQSSIRAGFGIYYDHYGQGLVTNYSAAGSFSLSSTIFNPSSVLTPTNSPRFTGSTTPPSLVPPGSAMISYPQTPSNDPNGTGFAITNGLDDRIKTPYSEVFNLSFQRQLPGGFTLEADYVGRLGRHLLQQEDLAQPLDLVDPASGVDYYAAATQLSQYADQLRPEIPANPYWEHLFPDAAGVAGGGTAGSSATQNIYTADFLAPMTDPTTGKVTYSKLSRGNETAALQALDVRCYPGCGGKTGRYWPKQYSSLYVTSSLGASSYNAGQFILLHPMKHGVQFDVTYTYSRSLDLGSDSENNTTGNGAVTNYGAIIDAFNPQKNYGLSDFNTTHLVTADWVLAVPTGRGQRFLRGSGPIAQALFGGWLVTGIARASSGLPFSITDGDGWSTNWNVQGNEVQTGPIKLRKHQDGNSSPQLFDDPIAAAANLRDPYPGEAGQRNKFNGDGYFDVDAGLHKSLALGERVNMRLAWEVFNVTNSTRFDVHNLDHSSTDNTQLGVYSAALTQSRRMQLSGRIEF